MVLARAQMLALSSLPSGNTARLHFLSIQTGATLQLCIGETLSIDAKDDTLSLSVLDDLLSILVSDVDQVIGVEDDSLTLGGTDDALAIRQCD